MRKIFLIIGTRPEAIKMAPLALLLKQHPGIECKLVSTGQHDSMLKQALADFDCPLDVEYHISPEGRTLSSLTCDVIRHVTDLIHHDKPDWILVQGDTTTAFAAGLVAFYEGVKVGHVEAGLRSFDMRHPFPEEANRKLVSAFASAHFAPTTLAQRYLLDEKVNPGSIYLTGNTVIDALYRIQQRIDKTPELKQQFLKTFAAVNWQKKVILATAHRRENHDENMHHICDALLELATCEDVEIIFPVHLSPKVREVVMQKLAGHPNIHLHEPFAYMEMVFALSQCHLVISDSGGIQEEAPSFGKPVLVMRETTERMEAVHAGTAKLVGANTRTIVNEALRLLRDDAAYHAMASVANPFGDGTACQKIQAVLLNTPTRPKP